MADLNPPSWPPAPIRTARLTLREFQARDRGAFIDLHASAQVNTYLGGPQPRADLEDTVPEIPDRRPGHFAVELDGAMIGLVLLERRNVGPATRVRPASGEVDLGYLFLPDAWGFGYAAEACTAVLTWFDSAFPGEPVLLVTQSANVGSMRLAARLGFVEVERFEKWGAEQWFGVRS